MTINMVVSFPALFKNTGLAQSVKRAVYGRFSLLRGEGYASGKNEQDHLGQHVPMVERCSERQFIQETWLKG